MLYVAGMIILSSQNIKKISFGNFDFWVAEGEKKCLRGLYPHKVKNTKIKHALHGLDGHLRKAPAPPPPPVAYWNTKGYFLQPQPSLGPVKGHVKDAKSLLPPIMADMCAWAGTHPAHAVFRPRQLKNRSFRNLFFFLISLFQEIGSKCMVTLFSSISPSF